ncbi:hypothetical protein BO221_31510 [Archangium sp. Cb G35]|uniref:enoyl-CoA hydratase/isomerase family protein n=1 Tax=Archangium sp. Cb G35 TaxID=1920190 RepID=UPI0009368961|nr:enoyl-CoA hydratase/isomerase family protein [Archangium sp. Cb G35]OJT20525.1 hypothetical protein BO221_31510 [Archangium sp. Cb G35]
MSGRFEARGDVDIIWIDNPPVNAISQAVRVVLLDGLKQAEANGSIQAVVIACDGRTFMAGVDITEFSGPLKSPGLPEVIDTLDAFSKPVLAALHGMAFGGGFEVALACDHRVAVTSTQVGLPDVKLGLLPGSGGTSPPTKRTARTSPRSPGALSAAKVQIGRSGRFIGQ